MSENVNEVVTRHTNMDTGLDSTVVPRQFSYGTKDILSRSSLAMQKSRVVRPIAKLFKMKQFLNDLFFTAFVKLVLIYWFKALNKGRLDVVHSLGEHTTQQTLERSFLLRLAI